MRSTRAAGGAGIGDLRVNDVASTTDAVVGSVADILDFHLAAAEGAHAVLVVPLLSDADHMISVVMDVAA